MDFSGWEFKIIQGSYMEVQKWLNQWKHEFELQFHEVTFWTSIQQEGVTVLLSRKKKGNEPH